MKQYFYESELVKQSIENNKRLSKRDFYDTRDISVELNTLKNAEGSCFLTLGKTEVVAGVKMAIETPYPDNPDEGSISVGVELSPMSDPNFDMGPPSALAVELSRVVDRSIRESKGIDFKKLCIKEGKYVWMIFVDIVVINNDGNLFEACELAALAALKNARFPQIELTEDSCTIIKGEHTDKYLEVSNNPILFNFVKINDKILLDPDYYEDMAATSRFSVTITNDKKIVAIQKGEQGSFTVDEIKEMVHKAINSYKEVYSKLEKAMKASK